MSSPNAKLILYGFEPSPPTRSVLLTLKALNLDYEFREVNTLKGEQRNVEFLRKNPQHTVPMLEDNTEETQQSLYIWDSHAICAYLVDKFSANDDALYPKEHFRRAIVDQRLHFDTGVLFHTCLKPMNMLIFGSPEPLTEMPKDKVSHINDAYMLLEAFLGENSYMTGDSLTIADFCIVATVSTFHLSYGKIDAKKYTKLSAWLARMSELPYYEAANQRGALKFADYVKPKLPKQFDKLWQKAFDEIRSGKQ